MEYSDIEAFLAIVQTRSLTKAAELLHLSQSTVSYRLKMLERELGATLVERGKGVPVIALTPFGESFVGLAERWNNLKREVDILQSGGPRASLAIGAADSLNVYVLPALYRTMSVQSPELFLTIRTQHTMESYESVERREVDVAFVKLERAVPNVLVEPFHLDEMVLVRPEHADNRRAGPVSPAELDGRQELYLNWGPSYELWHDRWWDPYDPSRIRLDAAALIFALMRDPRQWAIVPRSIVDSFVKAGGAWLVQRLSEPPPPRAGYKLTHRYPKPVKQAALDLLDRYVGLLYGGENSGESFHNP
ncbi:MAG TPA: LysR family transcriptional regulator [Selenomonadales bacterium]|nr:LysR family transcriptional regulator [Selenomonadales bacterium]